MRIRRMRKNKAKTGKSHAIRLYVDHCGFRAFCAFLFFLRCFLPGGTAVMLIAELPPNIYDKRRSAQKMNKGYMSFSADHRLCARGGFRFIGRRFRPPFAAIFSGAGLRFRQRVVPLQGRWRS